MSKATSAMGKSVDMSAIRARNEKVRAVGNMRVNARGDHIDSENRVVAPAGQRVNRVYTKTTANPTAVTKTAPASISPVAPSKAAPVVTPAPVIEYDEPSQEELNMFSEIDEGFVKTDAKSKKK